jgi:hypothetical protein
MTLTISRTTLPPEFIGTVNTLGTKIQIASGLRFYFLGGNDVICLRRDKDSLLVFFPIYCTINLTRMDDLLRPIIGVIDEKMHALKIRYGEWVMFDITRKCILTEDSFDEYVPISSMKNSIFMLDNADGTPDRHVYSLNDASDFNVLILAAIAIAKTDMAHPKNRATWSDVGVKLLFYLTSQRFSIPCKFLYTSGPWNTPSMSFNPMFEPKSLDLTQLKLDRAIELIKSRNSEIVDDEYEEFGFGFDANLDEDDDDDSSVYLSDLLEMGIKNFANDPEMSTIDVDIYQNEIRSMVLNSGILFVDLQPGSKLTEGQLCEMLGYSNIQLVMPAMLLGE